MICKLYADWCCLRARLREDALNSGKVVKCVICVVMQLPFIRVELEDRLMRFIIRAKSVEYTWWKQVTVV